MLVNTTKRKSQYKDVYHELYHGKIRRSLKGEFFAHCVICDAHINIAAMGRTAISHHMQSQKHQRQEEQWNGCSNDPSMYNIPAIEQNYIDASDYSAPTEFPSISTAIGSMPYASRVVSPENHQKTVSNLDLSQTYGLGLAYEITNLPFSVSCKMDQSVAVVVRFFNPTLGVRVRLIEYQVIAERSCLSISQYVKDSLLKNGLNLANISSFCGDNSKLHFGKFPELNTEESIYSNLRKNNENIIPVVWPVPMICRAYAKSLGGLLVDLDVFLFKLTSSYYYLCSEFTVKEEIRSFISLIEKEYIRQEVPEKRLMNFEKILQQLIKLWGELEAFIMSSTMPPRFAKDFFASPASYATLKLQLTVLPLLIDTLKTLQSSMTLFHDAVAVVETLRNNLSEQKCKVDCAVSLKLEESVRIASNFEDFFKILIDELDCWVRFSHFPPNCQWAKLTDRRIDFEHVKEIGNHLAESLDILFEETNALNYALDKILLVDNFGTMSPEDKWTAIFKNSSAKFPAMKRIVSFIFSIPTSNEQTDKIISMLQE